MPVFYTLQTMPVLSCISKKTTAVRKLLIEPLIVSLYRWIMTWQQTIELNIETGGVCCIYVKIKAVTSGDFFVIRQNKKVLQVYLVSTISRLRETRLSERLWSGEQHANCCCLLFKICKDPSLTGYMHRTLFQQLLLYKSSV